VDVSERISMVRLDERDGEDGEYAITLDGAMAILQFSPPSGIDITVAPSESDRWEQMASLRGESIEESVKGLTEEFFQQAAFELEMRALTIDPD
jgi:hypothetical protein